MSTLSTASTASTFSLHDNIWPVYTPPQYRSIRHSHHAFTDMAYNLRVAKDKFKSFAKHTYERESPRLRARLQRPFGVRRVDSSREFRDGPAVQVVYTLKNDSLLGIAAF